MGRNLKRINYGKKFAQNYDSKFEAKLHEGVLSDCEFHNKDYAVEYSIPKKYYPDFVNVQENGFTYLIESKGIFSESAEAAKYKHARNYLNEIMEEIIFLFQHPEKPLLWSKVRKDGTRMTHAEWADKNGFKWFTEETIREFLDGELEE